MRRFAYKMMILGIILIMGFILIMGDILYYIYIDKDLGLCLFTAGIILFVFGYVSWIVHF